VDEHGLTRLFEKIKDSGALKIMADRLNLKPGVWSSVYSSLGENDAIKHAWKDAVFGKHKRYDMLFKQLQKICHEKEIEFEAQGY